MRLLLLFAMPAVFFGSIRSDLNIGLRGLQQIRTLIPERLSYQEFAIVVDEEAFQKSLKSHSHPIKESSIPSALSICGSGYYISRWTISGEPIRLLDHYQEFEYGPYWLYPTAMHRLEDMTSSQPNGIAK